MKRLPVSVIMLTLNEEHNLSCAIESVRDWAEEIFVVDSLSTDGTVDIALERGVKIVQHPFSNFGDQWNWALERLPIRTPWTLKLDPDERVTAELAIEIRHLLEGPAHCCGYSVRRRLWFMGKPLHVMDRVLRLWQTGKCRFSKMIVNEHPIISGPVGKLRGILEHRDSPNLHHWYDKQNRYTTMGAIMKAKGTHLAVRPKLFGASLERRMFFKKIFFFLPFRYHLQWVHEAIWRGAILDGVIGLDWIRLRIESRRAVELKLKEIKLTGRIPEVPESPRGPYDRRVISSPLQKFVFAKSNDSTTRPVAV